MFDSHSTNEDEVDSLTLNTIMFLVPGPLSRVSRGVERELLRVPPFLHSADRVVSGGAITISSISGVTVNS